MPLGRWNPLKRTVWSVCQFAIEIGLERIPRTEPQNKTFRWSYVDLLVRSQAFLVGGGWGAVVRAWATSFRTKKLLLVFVRKLGRLWLPITSCPARQSHNLGPAE